MTTCDLEHTKTSWMWCFLVTLLPSEEGNASMLLATAQWVDGPQGSSGELPGPLSAFVPVPSLQSGRPVLVGRKRSTTRGLVEGMASLQDTIFLQGSSSLLLD